MVSIIIPKNSLTDLINAGMTYRHFINKGKDVDINIIDVEKKDKTWKNIKNYIGKDKNLLILNFPLPSEDVLKNMKIEPYDFSILYLPSKMTSITLESKKKLLEKGIVSMPKRESYNCFPGEYNDKVERKWMKIGKIVSLEIQSEKIDKKDLNIIKGILNLMEKDPYTVIKKIAHDDTDFFTKNSQYRYPKEREHIVKRDYELILSDNHKEQLIQLAFTHFIKCRKPLIGIKGLDSKLILTVAPTLAHFIFKDNEINTEEEWTLGKKAAMFISIDEDTEMGFIIGRLSRKNIIMKFGSPTNVIKKTLIRRLIGGKGPHGRSYRGINELFPGIEIIKNIVNIPIEAFENVTQIFKETGTEFEIII